MSYDSFCADIAKLYAITGSLSESGPPTPLGLRQRIPATSAAFIHGFITTLSGALVGDARFDMTINYDSTLHESFGLEAGEGEQLWILVANDSGATIERGAPVKWKASVDNSELFHVAVCAGGEDASLVMGVAQFDIPTGKAAYVLAYGAGVAIAGATVGSQRGLAIKMDGSIAGVIVQGADEQGFGTFLDDSNTDTELSNVFLNCRAR